MQLKYPQFEPGQVVRSAVGEHLVIAYQLGCQVFVEGKIDWYHPTKLIPSDAKANNAG